MSTRGALGFKLNEKYYVAYNHFDSYPKGLGQEVVDIVSSIVKEKGLKKLKNNVAKIRLVNEQDTPTINDIEKYKHSANTDVDNKSFDSWYCLLRQTQGSEMIVQVYTHNLDVMIDNFDFLKNSLSCEYAYIINLDNDTLELYEGFNHEPQKDNPLPIKQIVFETINNNDYYPVRYLGSFKLDSIPKDWTSIYPKED